MTDTKNDTHNSGQQHAAKEEKGKPVTGTQYQPFQDKREAIVPRTIAESRLANADPTSALLNSGVYPKDLKPEVTHTENEKAGAASPLAPADVEDRSRNAEDIQKEHEKLHGGLYKETHPGLIVLTPAAQKQQQSGS